MEHMTYEFISYDLFIRNTKQTGAEKKKFSIAYNDQNSKHTEGKRMLKVKRIKDQVKF